MKNALNALVAATLVFGAACVAHATPVTLAGDTIDASMNFTTNLGYGVGRISGFGLDAPFVVQDGPADQKNYANLFTLDVDGGSFKMQFLSSGAWLPGVEMILSGLDFSGGATLKSVTVASNLSGYSLTSSAHEIDLMLGNVSFNRNSYLTGTFVFAPSANAVPEPGSIALAATGIGLVGLARARRRAGRGRG